MPPLDILPTRYCCGMIRWPRHRQRSGAGRLELDEEDLAVKIGGSEVNIWRCAAC